MSDDLLTSTFERLRGRLWGMARHITGNDDDAADAVQEAFCRLWQRGKQASTDSEATGLSVTAVRNVSIDTVRRRNVRSQVELNERDAATDDEDDNAASTWQEREQLYQQIHDIIDHQLTDTQRRIVSMREIEGQSFDDIARTLGMTNGAVRVQLSRARKIVRECYRRKEEQQQ